MGITNGYKIRNEQKKDIVYCRMDQSMIEALNEIKRLTGISKSELYREAIRRLIKDVENDGEVRITI